MSTADSILSGQTSELINRIRKGSLTYLSEKKLISLADACLSIERNNRPGSFIEAGCALGGSAILIASLKNRERPFHVHDVFGMIPPPSNADTPDVFDRYKIIEQGQSKGIGRNKYYGYEENLYEIVQSNLTNFGVNLEEQHVNLIKGLVQDTLKIESPVALAHIDVDWYDPVMTCLERIIPHLVCGGIMIIDDYHSWGGCKKATDEYFRERHGEFILDDAAGSMKVTRLG